MHENVDICELCQREGMPLTRHHLIPRRTHRLKRIRKRFDRDTRLGSILMLCKPCHKQIHAVLDEKSLAEHYNNRERLAAHPDIEKFLRWIADKPADFVPRTRSARRR